MEVSLIRLLLSILLSVGFAFAQAPEASPPLIADKTASVTPNGNSDSMATPTMVRPDETHPGPLPDVPPLPKGETSLLGGTIGGVDLVRDRLTLYLFGGGRTRVLFDERTRVFREGKQVTLDDLKNGERASLDTTLDGTAIFARSIRLAPAMPTGQSTGQILRFDPASGELTLRDSLSPEPVTMRLAPNAAILRGDQAAAKADLRPGALVAVTFAPGGRSPTVRQISILASPGAMFVFAGRVEHFDRHRGLLVLVDPRNNQSYEVNFDPSARSLTQDLRQGTDVTVQARFDGTHYQAREITVNAPPSK